MTGRFANIIVDISHEKVDRPFQYLIPPQLQECTGGGNVGDDSFWQGQ